MVLTRAERSAENEKFIEFICEQCRNANDSLHLNRLIRKFIEKECTDRTVNAFYQILNNYKKKEVFEIENREARVRQFFALGVHINETLLTDLRQHATVNLDDAGHITKYEAHDGQLTLNGDHCIVKKRRETFALQADDVEEEEDDDLLDMELDLRLELQPPAPKKPRIEESGNGSRAQRQSTSSSATPISANHIRDPHSEEDIIVLDDDDKEEENVQLNMENVEVKIEDMGLQEDMKPEFLEPGNLLGPALEMVKQEVPEPVVENFEVKIENPEDMASDSETSRISGTAPKPTDGPVTDSIGTNIAQNLSEEQPASPQMNVVKTEEPDSSVTLNSTTPRHSRFAVPPRNPPAALPATPGTSSAKQPLAPTSLANNSAAPGAVPVLKTPKRPSSPSSTSGSSSSIQPTPVPASSGSQNLCGGQAAPTLINAVTAQEADISVALNSTNSGAASALETRNPLPGQPRSSSATQPSATTGSGLNTLFAPEQSAAPTIRRRTNPPAAHDIITLDDDDEEEVDGKPEIVAANASTNASVNPVAVEDSKPEVLRNLNPSKPVLSLSDHQSFLQQTKALISTMKLPVSRAMETRIHEMIDRILFRRQNVQPIEIYFFEGTIRHAVSLANINTSKVVPEEDSRSFVQFVLLLQMNIVSLNEPKLKELEDTLHEICQKSDNQQKKISVSWIEKVLEATLDILAPN